MLIGPKIRIFTRIQQNEYQKTFIGVLKITKYLTFSAGDR